jgi:hypothetical protein
MILAAMLAAAAPCTMAADDRAWIDRALAIWRTSEARLLKLKPRPLPKIVAIDGACTYVAPAGSKARPRWTGTPHGGTVRLPGGPPTPVGPISFAATEPDGTGFFAMSLPSVWRKAGVKSALGVEGLMDNVMLHELMHARQFYFANPALAELTKRHGLPDSIGDDSLQDRFGKDPAYAAEYARERDTLFAAAAAQDDAEARRLAGEALAMLRARRAKWFTGENAYWTRLDDIFLTMEGVGQWLSYAWTTAPFGRALPRDAALREVRRGGSQWTQDEGLALFLTIDRLVPNWQALAFAEQPVLAEALLARAANKN